MKRRACATQRPSGEIANPSPSAPDPAPVAVGDYDEDGVRVVEAAPQTFVGIGF